MTKIRKFYFIAYYSFKQNVKYKINIILNIISSIVFITFSYYIWSSIILGSLAFWFLKSNAAIKIGYDIHKFAQYPLGIYGMPIKLVLSCVFPYAFTNYFPVAYLLNKCGLIMALLSLLVCVVGFVISLHVWNRGLKKYEGSGA